MITVYMNSTRTKYNSTNTTSANTTGSETTCFLFYKPPRRYRCISNKQPAFRKGNTMLYASTTCMYICNEECKEIYVLRVCKIYLCNEECEIVM